MSNLATQARAIALIAREAFPNAKTVRLESSDQGDYLTYSTPFVIEKDGTEQEADDELSDLLWDPCCDISDSEIGSEQPGWTILNARGGYYEFDIDTILGLVPALKDSALMKTIEQFEHWISVLPSEPPIIMLHDAELNITMHCPRCGSEDVREMDWDTRWNKTEAWIDRRGDVAVSVTQADKNYSTLTWFCADCGQVIDMEDIEPSY